MKLCGLNTCPCDKQPPCKRHGDCNACVVHHRDHKPDKPLAWCQRPENADKVAALREAEKQASK